MRFRDRREAGRALARDLAGLAGEQPIVVALPRGGVPVGFEVAKALGARLEVFAVRKLGAPSNPEYGVGAVAEDGTAVLDRQAAVAVGMSSQTLGAVVEREVAELRRRVERYRAGRPMLSLAGRTVVLVDDGIATGVTDLAAVRAVRKLSPRRIVLAVPVAAPESLRHLAAEADEVVCPHIPRDFGGVGRWYEDFSQVTDEQVLDLLARANATSASRGTALKPAPTSSGSSDAAHRREFTFELGGRSLGATLILPAGGARALVVFAHGSGSSRHSPRNVAVAEALAEAGFASVLMDLLTEAEERDRMNVFDTRLLAERLVAVTRWVRAQPGLRHLPVGYFGASTGAAAALRAAARLGAEVGAVVSRGGRPDLADEELPAVTAPTLLIVGGDDWNVLEVNDEAATLLHCPRDLAIVPHAGHLFEEPGALDQVAHLAIDWFERHLVSHTQAVGDVA
jgi:predicted phosphoribosyltransferase/dienelactone hydrolase